MDLQTRITIEKHIAGEAVDALLAAGYRLSVFDGEETTVSKSRDAAAIKAALMTTDEDYLRVYEAERDRRIGWVQFVYGNDGWDVICDHTVNLEAALEPATLLAHKYEQQYA